MKRKYILTYILLFIFLSSLITTGGCTDILTLPPNGCPNASENLKSQYISLNLKSIQNAIREIQSLELFLPIETNISYLSRSNIALPTWVNEEFQIISNAVFLKTGIIKLISCETCQAMSDVSRMEIGISPTLINSIVESSQSNVEVREIVDFIIAHELSHYLYEKSIDISPLHLSPNGQMSMVRIAQNKLTNFCSIREDTIISARKHAEVDAFALAILKEMNKNLLGGAEFLAFSTQEAEKQFNDFSIIPEIDQQILLWMNLTFVDLRIRAGSFQTSLI